MIPSMSRTCERDVLHKGSKFDFERVCLHLEDGSTLEREIVRHPGAVVILPLLPDGRVAMIRNLRVAVDDWLLELPAGTIDRGEAPEICAARELIEETGWRADRLIPLGSFLTTPGLTDELMHAFLATDLTHVGERPEADERIQVTPVPLQTCFDMIDKAELIDAKSMLALLIALRRGLLPAGHA
ncbi:MAG: NUDIX hydrolase [Phycisphaerales bacterium]|nr:MAG: NUDIX hydrolase [Phycisphaerales bacterium]